MQRRRGRPKKEYQNKPPSGSFAKTQIKQALDISKKAQPVEEEDEESEEYVIFDKNEDQEEQEEQVPKNNRPRETYPDYQTQEEDPFRSEVVKFIEEMRRDKQEREEKKKLKKMAKKQARKVVDKKKADIALTKKDGKIEEPEKSDELQQEIRRMICKF